MEQLLQVAVAVCPSNLVFSMPVIDPAASSSGSSNNSAGSNVSDSDEGPEQPAIASLGVTCEVCKRVVHGNKLASHMGVHNGDRPHECATCGQGFVGTWDLSQHALSHSKVRPFPCSVCGKSFKRKWETTRHESIHKQEPRTFQCPKCNKFFQTKTTLASHMRIHTDDKPFACQLCDKRFKRKGELTLHNRSHTGERPFQCPHCSRGFRQKGTLTQHLATHTPDRPFPCPRCPMHFRHKSSVLRHLSVHEKAKSSANSSDALTIDGTSLAVVALSASSIECLGSEQPRRAEHKESRVQCAICGQQFKHRSSLNRHLVKHTGVPRNKAATQKPRPSARVAIKPPRKATARRRKGKPSTDEANAPSGLDFTIASAPAFSLDLDVEVSESLNALVVPSSSDLGDDDDDPVTIGRHRLVGDDEGDENDVAGAVGGEVYTLEDPEDLLNNDQSYDVDVENVDVDGDVDVCNVIMPYDDTNEDVPLVDDLLPASDDIDDLVATSNSDTATDLIEDSTSSSATTTAYVLPNGMSLRRRKRSSSQFEADQVDNSSDDPEDEADDDAVIFNSFNSLTDLPEQDHDQPIAAGSDDDDAENAEFDASLSAFTPTRMTRSAAKRQRCDGVAPAAIDNE